MPRTAAPPKPSSNGTKPKVFDLSQRFARDVVEVVIYDPAEPDKKIDTGIRIGIKSVYSKEARDAAQAARAQIVLDKEGRVVSSEADTDAAIFEQTVGATVCWFHADLSQGQRADGTWARETGYEDVLLIGTERLACTPENVRTLYADPKTAWIHRPVLMGYLNLAGFFGPPKTA